jgi:hypothetical protein
MATIPNAAGTVELSPQEIARVTVNLIGNDCFAAHECAKQSADQGFEPT